MRGLFFTLKTFDAQAVLLTATQQANGGWYRTAKRGSLQLVLEARDLRLDSASLWLCDLRQPARPLCAR